MAVHHELARCSDSTRSAHLRSGDEGVLEQLEQPALELCSGLGVVIGDIGKHVGDVVERLQCPVQPHARWSFGMPARLPARTSSKHGTEN